MPLTAPEGMLLSNHGIFTVLYSFDLIVFLIYQTSRCYLLFEMTLLSVTRVHVGDAEARECCGAFRAVLALTMGMYGGIIGMALSRN